MSQHRHPAARLAVIWLAVFVAAALFVLAAPAHPADAATECLEFALEHEVRPGPAQDLIGVPVLILDEDLPDHWLGYPGTIHVETANGPSVHWNNYLTLSTNGFSTNVTGTEDTANGVRIGDTNIDAIGPSLTGDYIIGTRDSRDVPGVEGASLQGTLVICVELPDETTTTTQATTTTTGGDTTTTTSGDTTTTGQTPSTEPPSTPSTHVDEPTPPTTVPPVGQPDCEDHPEDYPEQCLPFTGPEDMGGWAMAAGALILLGSAVVLGLREGEA